ncbi:LacI family DNA-binding transcriptional regulator [Kaistia dalseonensis]|uniref:DNA-binding LacI/PurR family transcriptional regulator n=1 Tax=Kaistia dalseonensis TaxID=410840 RepID=A0ABU0H4W9_9HYPH|nr:LacI family DNA-binding transcriptional regulator [Kaistia dalseonensis]MCX5494777.1 LacI family DNA-binding transcriptional regulator [Kaistia dalseonensis]MDQ0437358.1 DNA-binding LacI/PurR family transcriptional regulator [Kaistia dalseonensis]
MPDAKISLQDIARRLGVSAKTVSGALHGDGSIRMAEGTRARIKALADELGYVPNMVARGMRQGVMPIIGIVADGLITQPFATEILRAFDNSVRTEGLSVVVTSVGDPSTVEASVAELQRFMPRAIAYAAMYHQVVDLPKAARGAVKLMINCRDSEGEIASLVPAEREAAEAIVNHLFDRGRKSIAFLNLPGLLAGTMREDGFRAAHAARGLAPNEAWIRPATRGPLYSDRARSLVFAHVQEMLSGPVRPDAILCGNDRVALEAYNTLRRIGARIPEDVAVASFDNQVEIAARLDPPLTTMALPHRAIGRRAAEILAGQGRRANSIEEIPFRLVERASV